MDPVLIIFGGIWLLPALLLLRSRRMLASQSRFWTWFVLLLATSWFGWVALSLLAPRWRRPD